MQPSGAIRGRWPVSMGHSDSKFLSVFTPWSCFSWRNWLQSLLVSISILKCQWMLFGFCRLKSCQSRYFVMAATHTRSSFHQQRLRPLLVPHRMPNCWLWQHPVPQTRKRSCHGNKMDTQREQKCGYCHLHNHLIVRKWASSQCVKL